MCGKLRLKDSASNVGGRNCLRADHMGATGSGVGASHLFTTHGVTIANGVHDILEGLSFPVIVTNLPHS